jgi:hypothetical protein
MVLIAISVTYIIEPNASTEDPRNSFKIVLSVQLWRTERSRIKDIVEILVQGFLDDV